MQRDLVAYEGREYVPEHFLRPETVAAVVAQAVSTRPTGTCTKSSSARASGSGDDVDELAATTMTFFGVAPSRKAATFSSDSAAASSASASGRPRW